MLKVIKNIVTDNKTDLSLIALIFLIMEFTVSYLINRYLTVENAGDLNGQSFGEFKEMLSKYTFIMILVIYIIVVLVRISKNQRNLLSVEKYRLTNFRIFDLVTGSMIGYLIDSLVFLYFVPAVFVLIFQPEHNILKIDFFLLFILQILLIFSYENLFISVNAIISRYITWKHLSKILLIVIIVAPLKLLMPLFIPVAILSHDISMGEFSTEFGGMTQTIYLLIAFLIILASIIVPIYVLPKFSIVKSRAK
ncbi:hypothetical protein BG261_01035 [Floricoccus tropicus]|uniref:Uncharacterized protein n=1 Tax=Floricoccus tropicus TaxID=1859473 RepID=A0A1E8GQI4_9LACT|nr:hypothetical protein [Floricoccus tropicus]OFI50494.1 hypothetical protein BG261_01035 [Floricoccus tropicus]